MSVNLIIAVITGLIKTLRAEAANLRNKASKHDEKAADLHDAAETEEVKAHLKRAEAQRAERFADKVESLITE